MFRAITLKRCPPVAVAVKKANVALSAVRYGSMSNSTRTSAVSEFSTDENGADISCTGDTMCLLILEYFLFSNSMTSSLF